MSRPRHRARQRMVTGPGGVVEAVVLVDLSRMVEDLDAAREAAERRADKLLALDPGMPGVIRWVR